MIAIAGVVDAFRKVGRSTESPAPQISFADRYKYGRDIRKAAANLRARGLELWLVDEWIDYEDVAQSFFTRRFRIKRGPE